MKKTIVGSISIPSVWPGHPDWEPRDELHWSWIADRRVCADCESEVYAFHEGLICSHCGRTDDDGPQPQ